jgi:hypothetical protein
MRIDAMVTEAVNLTYECSGYAPLTLDIPENPCKSLNSPDLDRSRSTTDAILSREKPALAIVSPADDIAASQHNLSD